MNNGNNGTLLNTETFLYTHMSTSRSMLGVAAILAFFFSLLTSLPRIDTSTQANTIRLSASIIVAFLISTILDVVFYSYWGSVTASNLGNFIGVNVGPIDVLTCWMPNSIFALEMVFMAVFCVLCDFIVIDVFMILKGSSKMARKSNLGFFLSWINIALAIILEVASIILENNLTYVSYVINEVQSIVSAVMTITLMAFVDLSVLKTRTKTWNLVKALIAFKFFDLLLHITVMWRTLVNPSLQFLESNVCTLVLMNGVIEPSFSTAVWAASFIQIFRFYFMYQLAHAALNLLCLDEGHHKAAATPSKSKSRATIPNNTTSTTQSTSSLG